MKMMNISLEKLLSMEGMNWSLLDLSLDDDSSNDDGRNLVNHSESPAINGLVFNNFESSSDTMKLKREDMYLFGRRPAWDDFYLVVCEYCGQVIKPQALVRHIETRHKSSANHIEINESDYRSHQSTNSAIVSTNHVQNANNDIINSNISSIKCSISRDCPKSVSLEPIPPGPGPGNLASIPSSSSYTLSLSSSITTTSSTFTTGSSASTHSNPQMSGVKQDSNKRNSQTNLSQGKYSNSSSLKKCSVRGKLLPCKDREYDPNKHCGVKTPDMDKPCTRSLTCKTHSLTLRRSVQERSKNFDDLLAEHRAAKEAAWRAAGIEIKPTKQQLKQREQELKRQMMNVQKEGKASISNNNNVSNMVNSPASNNCKSLPIEDPEKVKKVRSPERSSSYISCNGSLYLPIHPKPLALCTFNARQLSLSSLNCDSIGSHCDLSSRLFNRKRDLSYSALSIFRKKTHNSNNNSNGTNQNLLSMLELH